MNIYIYSDESGVFDKVHNDIFVFGGLIILGKSTKEYWSRRYSSIEQNIRRRGGYPCDFELKATSINNGEKHKIYKSLSECYKFGLIINQKHVLDRIFESKKDKQRYLDFAYKIAVKKSLEDLMSQGIFRSDDVADICFFVDEHNTATNGCYDLKNGLESELKSGTYNINYDKFFPPLFPDMNCVQLTFCNSSTTLLIRAADIVAIRIYYLARKKIIF